MNVKIAFLALLLLGIYTYSYSSNAEQLKKIRSDIAQQEQQLKSLEGDRSNIVKEIELLQDKLGNERRALNLLNKSVQDNNIAIKKLADQQATIQKKIDTYASLVKDGMIFVVENTNNIHARALISGSDLDNSTALVEITTVLSGNINEQVSEYIANINSAKDLEAQIAAENNQLKENAEAKADMLARYSESQKQLQAKLNGIKQNESYKKAYLDSLKTEEKKITNAIKAAIAKSTTVTTTVSGVGKKFALLKGALPYPMVGKVIEPFGEKYVPEADVKFMHKGLKIAPTTDGKVNVIADGTVLYLDYINGMGNIIIVQHDSEYYSVYANLDEFYVEDGRKLKAGELLGVVDAGIAGGSYLYLELRKHDVALNPSEWLRK